MPPEGLVVRLQRTLAILLEHDRDGPVPLAELAERWKIEPELLRRDLEVATRAGVAPFEDYNDWIQVVPFPEDDTVDIAVPGVFRQGSRLTGAEGFAVLTAAATVGELRPDDDDLRSATAKLADALGGEGEVRVDLGEPTLLSVLLDGEEQRRVVQGRYWSHHRDRVDDRTLEPLHVFYGGGSWYARCRDRGDGAVKLFRVDRFESASLTDETFAVEDGPGVSSTSLFSPGPDSHTVTVRFPADARWVDEILDLHVEDESEEHFIGRFEVTGTAWLENLLLRSGGEVLAPPSLVGLGAAAAQRALEQYE